MLPLGIMVGLAVRMGHVIAFDPQRAKLLVVWCMTFITVAGAILSSLLYAFRLWIIQLFTMDPAVIDLSLRIWPFLCVYTFLLYIFGISSAVYRGLGMQWRLAAIITFALYFLLLPAVIYWAVVRGGGLYRQWTLLPAFYALMQIALVMGYITVDWEAHSKHIRDGIRQSILQRAALEAASTQGPDDATNERTRLLP